MVRKSSKAKDKVTKDGIGVSSTYMQLRSRRIDYVSVHCKSKNLNSSIADNGVSSCCASNDYRNVVVDRIIDLDVDGDEGDTKTSTFRRNTKRKLLEDHREKSIEDSSETSDCCYSGRRASTAETEEKVKSTTEEIEEFFVKAEKKVQEKFKKKYNFDFEKEKPLEGAYEWIKLSD